MEITPLPDADALELIRDFQPGHRVADAAQEAAARELAAALAGYTLAVELVAAYLHANAADLTPTQYLERLRGGGLLDQVDPLLAEDGVAGQIRHQQAPVYSARLVSPHPSRVSTVP